MLRVGILAMFSVVSLAVAIQAIRSGRATFRGEHSERATQPVEFWMSVAIYLVMGLLMLTGLAWEGIRQARGR